MWRSGWTSDGWRRREKCSTSSTTESSATEWCENRVTYEYSLSMCVRDTIYWMVPSRCARCSFASFGLRDLSFSASYLGFLLCLMRRVNGRSLPRCMLLPWRICSSPFLPLFSFRDLSSHSSTKRPFIALGIVLFVCICESR